MLIPEVTNRALGIFIFSLDLQLETFNFTESYFTYS